MILPTTTSVYNHLIDYHNGLATFPPEDTASDYVDNDDDTVINVNTSRSNTRFNISFSLPDDTPPKEVWAQARNQLNTIIKYIDHSYADVKIKVAPWRDSPKDQNEAKHLSVLPSGADDDAYEVCKPYIQGDWSPWMKAGQTKYLRINLFHSDIATQESMSIVAQKCRDGASNQWVSVSASHALDPISLGFFFGSVEAMGKSDSWTAAFGLSFPDIGTFGFDWKTINPRSKVASKKGSKVPRTQRALFIEIDQSKKEVAKKMFVEFFNTGNNSFLGTRMKFLPFSFTSSDIEHGQVRDMAPTQNSLLSSLQCIQIPTYALTNTVRKVSSNDKASTDIPLLQDLVELESLHAKKSNKGDKTIEHKGKLFYAIILHKDENVVSFFYMEHNSLEARSVASALPLFIRDHFKLSPASYCTSSQISAAQAGKWDFKQRIYQSENEVACHDHKLYIEAQIRAQKTVQFVSPDHRRASGMLDEEESIVTKLQGKGPVSLRTQEADPAEVIQLDGKDSPMSSIGNSVTSGNTSKSRVDKACISLTLQHNQRMDGKEKENQELLDRILQLEIDEATKEANLKNIEADYRATLEKENEEKMEAAKMKLERELRATLEAEIRKTIELERNQTTDKSKATDNNTPSKIGGSNRIPETPEGADTTEEATRNQDDTSQGDVAGSAIQDSSDDELDIQKAVKSPPRMRKNPIDGSKSAIPLEKDTARKRRTSTRRLLSKNTVSGGTAGGGES